MILSASRRTDLPGWHPEALARRVCAWRNTHGRERLYGVVFWTRFPGALLRPPLRALLEGPERVPSAVVNLTITGLGGTPLEPRAPAGETLRQEVADLVSLLGDPARLRWRFDPLLPTADLLDRFRRWGDWFSRLGVPTCTLSFPATRSLRGALTTRYARFGVPVWPPAHTAEGRAARSEAVARLVAQAEARGIRLLVCSQPATEALHPALGRAQCIPGDLLGRDQPTGLPPPSGRDRTQRAHCQCAPSEDIGDYREDVCRTGCLYCYSTLGGPDGGQTVPWFLRER